MSAPTATLPRIGITLGDPAGVGPELCLQWLAQRQTATPGEILPCQPLIFGDAAVLKKLVETAACQFLRPVLEQLKVVCWQDYVHSPDSIQQPTLIDMGVLTEREIHPATVTAAQGKAAYTYIETAIQQALQKHLDAIVTGPIHKEALHAAGIPHPGHTEILAEKTGAEKIVMMLTSPAITCSLVTAHVGYAEVPALLTQNRIQETILLTHAAMRKMRGKEPVLTVCGLNPHAGEQGLFGQQEEERFIKPAIAWAQAQGLQISGPFPPDTAFLPGRRAQTDAYICMYHDQGLIPLKALAFDEAVNITLGLPIIRTSVDHGTAFDIAWQGKAAVSSLIQAINLACRLASA